MPPQEITGICSSVRPKRRYFMRGMICHEPEKSSKLKAQSSNHELQFLPVRNQPAFEGPAKETPDRLASIVAVIEGPVIDVHPDELVSEVAAHAAGEMEGVLRRFGAVIEAVTDAGGEDVRDRIANGRSDALVNDIPAEGQGKPVILPAPPDAQVFAGDQA